MSEIRLPASVKRLLKVGNIDRVDLYAGRLIRNGEGRMTYRSANGNGNGAGHADAEEKGHQQATGARDGAPA